MIGEQSSAVRARLAYQYLYNTKNARLPASYCSWARRALACLGDQNVLQSPIFGDFF